MSRSKTASGRRVFAGIAVGLILSAGFAAPALAADTAGQVATVGELIVTAQKRESTIQKVPFSVAAQSEAQIRATGATNLPDLARNVAGLAIADLGPGQSQVAIRGVSSGQVVRDESSRKETVGIYLDESVISSALFTPDLELFDLQRLEVLRGPQGTLFGSGSEGGTIRYITVQPKLGATEGVVEASGGGVQHGSGFYDAKGAVNLPLGDMAALRAVAYYDHFGGFIDAIDQSGAIHQNVNDGNKYGGRLALLFKPTDNITITPRLVYQHLKTNGYPRGDVWNLFRNPFTTTRPAGTFGPLQQFRQTPEGLTDRFVLGDVVANVDLSGVKLTSVSSYTDRDVKVLRDTAQLAGQIDEIIVGIPGSAVLNAPLVDHTTLKVFSQEVRLASNTSGPLTWLVGAFYLHQDKTYGQHLSVPGFEAMFNAFTGHSEDTGADALPVSNERDALFVSHFDIRHRQWAIFGEGSYDITDQLTATAGLRWYDFKESRNAVIAGFYNCSPCATPVDLRQRTTSANGFNPRFILAYKATPDVTFNAQASKGFRLGGINDPLITAICGDDIAALGGADIERFAGESTWNYEVGMKSRFAGGKVTFNTAAYYEDISNLQVSARLACSSTIILNVPKASVRGFEGELSARPMDHWSIGANVAYNDSRIDKGVTFPNPAGPSISKGWRLPTSPKWQLSGNATYDWDVSSDLNAFVGGVVQYQSSSYSFVLDQANGGTLPFSIRYGRTVPLPVAFPTLLHAYTLANLRAGLRKSGDFEASVWVTNLFDTHAELALDRERGGEGRVAYLRNQPRTFGVTVRKEF